MQGGPNWAKNVVDAPIIANASSGEVFYKQPMFYYLGHFSKFLKPGAQRIGMKSTGVPIVSSPMEATAFIMDDGARIAVVVLNRDISSHKFTIHYPTRGYIQQSIPAHAIQTVIFAA